ncbi:MAG: metal-dependent hydrolase [Halobacteriota archaeon]
MPGPVIHIGVALVALLVYFDDRHRKYVLLLLPFAMLPDLDHFAPFYAGRDILHNVFLLVPPLAIALYGVKTKNNLLYSVALMAGFLLFSHLVLDFFNGGEALFYPLRTPWYGFTNTWQVAHGAVALLPEPLRGVTSVVFGGFARPEVAHPAVALLPEPLRGMPSEAYGITLTFVALAVILFVERQLQFDTDVRGRAERT